MGNSPRHARSVGLILNLSTGLVSPQYHVDYDGGFETSRKGASGLLPKSRWQEEAGFKVPTNKDKGQGSKRPLDQDVNKFIGVKTF